MDNAASRHEPRVSFVPRYLHDPYTTQLEKHLEHRGVRMVDLGAGLRSMLWTMVRRRPEIIHLHWLDPFFLASNRTWAIVKLAAFMFAILGLRLFGRKMVWTAHNLRCHEPKSRRLDWLCTRFVVRNAHAIIAHCPAARRAVGLEFDLRDSSKIFIVPHGNFSGVYQNRVSRSDARRKLSIAEHKFLFLFIGQIRPYKGALELVEAFREIPCGDAQLLLAGKPLSDEWARTVAERCHSDPRIMFCAGFVEPDDIQVHMNAADVVVFPYRDILTSGAVVLAMSFGKACIAPRIGCIPETLDANGGFLYAHGDPDGLKKALQMAIDRRGELPAMGERNRHVTEDWDWDRIAEMTHAVYCYALGGAPAVALRKGRQPL